MTQPDSTATYVPPPPTPRGRLALLLARVAVRRARQRLRAARSVDRSWRYELVSDDLRLVPVTTADADAWFALVARGVGPPAEGLTASSIGGAARTPRRWRARVRAARRAARHGGHYAYLVHADGALIGEALAFVDRGTSVGELVVWLAGPARPTYFGPVIEIMAGHVVEQTGVARVLIMTPADDELASTTLPALEYVREGERLDPPRGACGVWVHHVTADPAS